jgi:hypothetical protein
MDEWKPERKILAGAVTALLMWGAQLLWPDLEIPPGVEAAVVVVVGYLVPNPS